MSVNGGPRILVMTKNRTGRRMASPGIRAYHIARVLAENVPGAHVTLATPSPEGLPAGLPFGAVPYKRGALVAATLKSDIVIGSRFPLFLLPLLQNKRLVLDMFTPYVTEWIEVAKFFGIDDARQNTFFSSLSRDLMVQLILADCVLCATLRQRDLYFGMLSALGRVTPETYDNDHWLAKLLTHAPFGVRPDEPKPTRRVLKGVWPGIQPTDTLLIWNGGIIEWYDVETLIQAIHRISKQRPDIKLFFLGTEHPDNPGNAPKLHGLGGGTQRSAYQLCRELDLLDKFVFFNFDWIEYDDTVNYLCEADIGICTYFDNIETHFSFRSRLLDLLWTELPIICTQGDVWAELVARGPLGIAVPQRNEAALADAILKLADDRALVAQCKENLRREKEAHRWERSLEGLVRYCREPARPIEKWGRLLPLTTTLASSLESKLRLAIYRRWDNMRYSRARPAAPEGA